MGLRYYFDASALVKRFKPERGQQTVRELLVAASKGVHEIVSLDWSRAEFCVAMKKGGVPMARTMRNLKLLARIAIFQPITKQIIDESLKVIFNLGLHAADAAHISACERFDCDVLASDDSDLMKAMVEEYLRDQGIQLLNLSQTP